MDSKRPDSSVSGLLCVGVWGRKASGNQASGDVSMEHSDQTPAQRLDQPIASSARYRVGRLLFGEDRAAQYARGEPIGCPRVGVGASDPVAV